MKTAGFGITLLALLAACFLLGACKTAEPATEPTTEPVAQAPAQPVAETGSKSFAVPTGKAAIYLYRPGETYMATRTIFMILPNDSNSWSLVDGGYYALVVDPGRYTIGAMGTDMQVSNYAAEVKAGEVRYLRVRFSRSVEGKVPAEFQEVDAPTGLKEIRLCKVISRTK